MTEKIIKERIEMKYLVEEVAGAPISRIAFVPSYHKYMEEFVQIADRYKALMDKRREDGLGESGKLIMSL